jgi:hypothetical protein
MTTGSKTGALAEWTPEASRSTACLTIDDETFRVTFSSQGAELEQTADSLLAMVLLPAMRSGRNAQVVGDISPRLAAASSQIQALLHSWDPHKYRVVELNLTPRLTAESSTGRTACLFSSGLDSLAEVLSRGSEIDDLLYVHGFDVPFGDTPRREDAQSIVRAAAAGLGFPLLEIETDMRVFSDRFFTWEEFHGAGLAAIAHLLQKTHRRLRIATSHVGEQRSAWGSHPLLDPLWSTERMEIVHSQPGVSRVEKAALIASSEVAMANLRVCYLPPPGMVNCGRCEKCLRTAVSLAAVGALGRCKTLPGRVDPVEIANLQLRGFMRTYWVDNLVGLSQTGAAPTLAAAVEVALARESPRDDHAELESLLRFDLGRGEPSGGGRLSAAGRRAVLRAVQPYTYHQRRFDERLVSELRAGLDAERRARLELEHRLERLEHHDRRSLADQTPPPAEPRT